MNAGLAPNDPDVLQGISGAFVATLDREGSGAVIAVWVILVCTGAVVVVRWLRSDARRERRERRALEKRREAVAAEPPPRLERREWVRVPAHVAMSVARAAETGVRAHVDLFETQNLSGGGVAFLADHPPACGTRLELTLDLGTARPLAVYGVIVRVDPPHSPEAPSLVALKFGNLAPAIRERLVKWIATEEVREIALARRGRVCACCKRPLADSHEEMHSTCAARVAKTAAA
jgi:hypothetical protein